MLSILAPSRFRPDPALVAWLERNTQRQYISVVTLSEIESGIAKLRREGHITRADRLTTWLEHGISIYASRILAFDSDTARIAGRLFDLARSRGYVADVADAYIAATAQSRGFTILTRNLRHFSPLGLPVHDPFASLPPG